MSQQTPDEIRREIEETRARLSSDVDAVAEKVSPSAVIDRQTNRLKEGLSNMKDKIMGTDETTTTGHVVDRDGERGGLHGAADQAQRVVGDVQDKAAQVAGDVQSKAGELADSAKRTAEDAQRKLADAPRAVERQTRGNPLAAGLVAFGLGMLVASLIPASKAEQQAADQLKEKAEPLVRDAQEKVQQLAQDAKGPLAEAGEQLRQVAQDSLQNVKAQGADHAQHLASEAKSSAEEVKGA
ncbi:hypothetical protein USB125703_00112 [Pseudoclavibacter triregionum]|nr:hypothetical protein USB125703_00112 [Pseudoclavibacter triregionum]